MNEIEKKKQALFEEMLELQNSLQQVSAKYNELVQCYAFLEKLKNDCVYKVEIDNNVFIYYFLNEETGNLDTAIVHVSFEEIKAFLQDICYKKLDNLL